MVLVKDLEDEVCSVTQNPLSDVQHYLVAESKCLLVAVSNSSNIHVVRVDLEDNEAVTTIHSLSGDDTEVNSHSRRRPRRRTAPYRHHLLVQR